MIVGACLLFCASLAAARSALAAAQYLCAQNTNSRGTSAYHAGEEAFERLSAARQQQQRLQDLLRRATETPTELLQTQGEWETLFGTACGPPLQLKTADALLLQAVAAASTTMQQPTMFLCLLLCRLQSVSLAVCTAFRAPSGSRKTHHPV